MQLHVHLNGLDFLLHLVEILSVFIVVIVGVLSLSWIGLKFPPPLRLLRILRALRVFRLFKRVKSLNKIISALAGAIFFFRTGRSRCHARGSALCRACTP